MPIEVNEYKIGKGKLYIDILDANNSPQGERFLGNAPGFSISISTETIEHYSSIGGLREKDLEITSQIDRTAQVTVDSLTRDNMALFLVGDVNTVVQSSESVTDEAITVQQGRWYQLGASLSNPTGVRNLSAVVVQDDTDTTTFIEDADYELDLARGRLYVIAGGAINDNEVLHIDYTTAATTRERIATSTTARKARVRFLADNPNGANDDVFIPLASLKPSGDLQFIGDDVLSVNIDLGISKATGYEAIYIDGQPV